MISILIYGLGQFGFALLHHLDHTHTHHNHSYTIYGYDIDQSIFSHLQKTGKHPKYFTDIHYRLSPFCKFIDTIQDIQTPDIVIFAVPSPFLLDTAKQHLTTHVASTDKISLDTSQSQTIFINVTKALSPHGTLFSQEFANLGYNLNNYVMLAGGMIAHDLMYQTPLGCTLGCPSLSTLQTVKHLFQSPKLYIQITQDLIGVERSANLKNIASIYTGYLQGQSKPLGTQTYFLARFSEEIQHIVSQFQHIDLTTFSSSSQCRGNDFVMSCLGDTRNKQFGIHLAQTGNYQQSLDYFQTHHITIEGTKTLPIFETIVKSQLHNYPTIEKCINLQYLT